MTADVVVIQPFEVAVDQRELDTLQRRLEMVRIADDLDGHGWDYGTNTAVLAELMRYWRNGFDWRRQERGLNTVPQYIAVVDGVRVHYAHHVGEGPQPLPIVLTHGWPSGYLEMTKLADRLARPDDYGGDPSDAFDVIVPSLPGFGFSGPPPPGTGYRRVASVLHAVMTEGLGYHRFGLHSTGAGAFVNGWLALDHPESVAGYHTHDPNLMPPPSFEPPASPPTDDELAFRMRAAAWAAEEGAYGALHRTKPQTIGHALADSPAGMASWLLEKHHTWSDCGGDVTNRYTFDELLTGFTTYWVTNTIASSMRAYYERVHHDPQPPPGSRLDVPTGVAMPRDVHRFPPRRVPRETVERAHDLQHWVDLPRGGHFASWGEPDLVADSIRTFFRPLRTRPTDEPNRSERNPAHG